MPNGKDLSFVSEMVSRSWKVGGPALLLMICGAGVIALPLLSEKYTVETCIHIGKWLFLMAVGVYLVMDLLDSFLKRSYAKHRVEQEGKVVEVLGMMAASKDISAEDFKMKSEALERAVDHLILDPGSRKSGESPPETED